MATPAGWYDDGSGTQRYWDGERWTDQVAPAAPGAAAPAAPPAAPDVPAAPTAPQTASETPPPPPAAPVAHSAPQAPQKKRRLGLWIGLGVGGFLLLVGGGIAALVLFVLNATSGPREVYADFVDAVREGDCGAAYELLHDDVTGGLSEAEFCADSGFEGLAQGESFEYSIKSVNVENDNGTLRVVETVDIDGEKTVEEWEYTFVKEDGEWLLSYGEFIE